MASSFKIAIAGLGTVGCGVIEIIQQHRELLAENCSYPLEIVAVSARSKKDRGINLSAYEWYDNPRDLLSTSADCIVELIGGEGGVALELVSAALDQGKHIVTANKALLARHGATLSVKAQRNKRGLCFEAAICGGIPIVKTLREGLAANKIESVSGIMNGTCNYILSTMEESGRSFDDVLAEAQAKGFAETPPDLDIDGIDAAHKLCLLAALAFKRGPDFQAVRIEGIRGVTAEDIRKAKDSGYVIRLICSADEKGAMVKPERLALGTPLASIKGPQNAVLIKAEPVGEIFMSGAGAGRGPTASAVVADIIDLARGNISFGLSVTLK